MAIAGVRSWTAIVVRFDLLLTLGLDHATVPNVVSSRADDDQCLCRERGERLRALPLVPHAKHPSLESSPGSPAVVSKRGSMLYLGNTWRQTSGPAEFKSLPLPAVPPPELNRERTLGKGLRKFFSPVKTGRWSFSVGEPLPKCSVFNFKPLDFIRVA